MNVHLNLKEHDVLQFEIVRSSDSSNKYNRPSNNAHRATLYWSPYYNNSVKQEFNIRIAFIDDD